MLIAYATVVGVTGQVVGSDWAPATGVTAALVAVALLPVRGRLQRGVDRLMYGEGGDPYRAVTGLTDRLTAVAAPGEALQTVVDTIRGALRASYVAVEIDGRTAAAAGSSGDSAALVRPIVHQGVILGDLVLGPTLAGVALGIDVAIGRLDVDPIEARALLKEVKDETNAAVDEVRRIAYALRPPALDELGLTGPVAQTAERLSRGRGGLVIDVEAVGTLPALAAATAVAACRRMRVRASGWPRCESALQSSAAL